MKEINIVIEDLEMLKNGNWIPDEHSCNCSIENLEVVKDKIKRLYDEKTIIKLIQFLSMNKDFNSYSSVSPNTAKLFFEKFKITL